MERPKYRYHLAFQCTKNGVLCRNRTMYITASSEAEAKRIVKEYYSDAKAFRVIGKWDNTTKKTNKTQETKTKESVTPKTTESNYTERKYTGAYINAYEELIYTTWKKRQEIMRAQKREMEWQYSRKLFKMRKKHEADRKKLNEELYLTEKALEVKIADLEKIGFFQFKEKKNIKAEIAELKQRQTSIQQNMEHLEENFSAQTADLEQEQAQVLEGLYREAKRKVPTTRNPPSCEADARYSWLSYILLEMEPGKRYTMSDLHDFPEVRHLNTLSITSVFRLPVATQNTKRTVEQGQVYYTLSLPNNER